MTDENSLIRVLLNLDARFDERDDAAMDLESYNGLNVISALAKIASDPREDPGLVDSAAESLGGVMARTGFRDAQIIEGLTPSARVMVISILNARS
ncbi:hypothetical protein ACGFR6_02615 [Streptomyces sp. NPDC048567]|uniref:hypothetical protein n=1 Tax=Streptomyces sp. NPDC048567 TaxID=3365570 RepID=UPI00371F7274